MDRANTLLPDIKEEYLTNTQNIHNNIDYDLIIGSDQLSTTSNVHDHRDISNHEQLTNPSNPILLTSSPTVTSTTATIQNDTNTTADLVVSDNTAILLSSSPSLSSKAPVLNDDLELLPPLPDNNDLNLKIDNSVQHPQPNHIHPNILDKTSISPLPIAQLSLPTAEQQLLSQTSIMTENNPVSNLNIVENIKNEELNFSNALDMGLNDTKSLPRSTSFKSVLKARPLTNCDTFIENDDKQELYKPVTSANSHIQLPKSVSRSNSYRRVRDPSLSSTASASANSSPLSQIPTSNISSTAANKTSSTKFPLLRKASSTLLRKVSFKSLNNNNNNNNSGCGDDTSNNNTNNTFSSNEPIYHNTTTSPLFQSTGFDNNSTHHKNNAIISIPLTPSVSSSSSSSTFHDGKATPNTSIPKSRPSLRLRVSSTTPSVSTPLSNTSQTQQSLIQRSGSILSRKSSFGSKMKLNITRIISGSSNNNNNNNKTGRHKNVSNDYSSDIISPIHNTQTKIINGNMIITSRTSSSINPSPSTTSSFPSLYNKDSNILSNMVSVDLQSIDTNQPTIITLDDSLPDIATISKESNVSKNILSENGKDQISLKDYYSLLKNMSQREESHLKFIEDRFNQSGWFSNNELNQLKQRRVIINRLWKEKLQGYDLS